MIRSNVLLYIPNKIVWQVEVGKPVNANITSFLQSVKLPQPPPVLPTNVMVQQDLTTQLSTSDQLLPVTAQQSPESTVTARVSSDINQPVEPEPPVRFNDLYFSQFSRL